MARTDSEIEKDIFDEYVALSPENVYCDGEATKAEAEATTRKINARLEVLFKELGRRISEEESWDNYLRNRGR